MTELQEIEKRLLAEKRAIQKILIRLKIAEIIAIFQDSLKLSRESYQVMQGRK